MDSFFTFYWQFLGKPFSLLKGFFVELIPFSLVELLIWLGIFCSLTAFRESWRYFKISKVNRKGRLYLWWAFGPVLLFFLASGQKALPGSPAPTALRQALWNSISRPEIKADSLNFLRTDWEEKFLGLFDSTRYTSLKKEEYIKICKELMDSTFTQMGFPKGRYVNKIKSMWGLSRIMGLSYGGPAFHDPLTGEVAWVDDQSFPTPKTWRIKAACHEMAHAKGFTREMDAEILTTLAFLKSQDSLYRSLGYLMLLNKSGRAHKLPEFLKKEAMEKLRLRQEIRKKQWMVRLLTHINKAIGLQNSGEKYGEVDPRKKWNPKHPFFTTVYAYGKKWELDI